MLIKYTLPSAYKGKKELFVVGLMIFSTIDKLQPIRNVNPIKGVIACRYRKAI